MKRQNYLHSLHPDIPLQLQRWGGNLRLARERRKLTAKSVCEALLMDRRTLAAVESGSPHVAAGAYAALQHYYGFLEQLELLAAPSRDTAAMIGPDNRF